MANNLNEIHKDVLSQIGEQDFKYFKKMERWGRICSLLAYGTVWIIPNSISTFLISQGSSTRWTHLTHPVVHKGYDKIDNVPEHYTSKNLPSAGGFLLIGRAGLHRLAGIRDMIYFIIIIWWKN